ncbi:MAG: hypothetical protein ACOX47_14725 [Bacillota bacterium]
MPEVQRAFKEGIIGLPLCTTNGYVYEEMSGKTINKGSYCCGFIFASGFCKTNFSQLHSEVVFVKGEEKYLNFPEQNLLHYIKSMTDNDVIIKSGNVIDVDKQAGLLVGEPNGGEFGTILSFVLAKGIRLVIPMTLNKTAPIKINEVCTEIGLEKITAEMSHGTSGMLPMHGKVITEIEALKLLTGTTAIPVDMSGVGTGVGAVTLMLKGKENNIKEAWELVLSIKGEPPIEPIHQCPKCKAEKASGVCEVRLKNASKI